MGPAKRLTIHLREECEMSGLEDNPPGCEKIQIPKLHPPKAGRLILDSESAAPRGRSRRLVGIMAIGLWSLAGRR